MMRWLLGIVVAGTALAQTPPQQAPPKIPKTMLTQIPGLYWARVGTVVNQAVPQLPAPAKVRIFMDAEGAITGVVFEQRSMLQPYNDTIETKLAEFAPSAKRRLPVARDAKLRQQSEREGVLVKIGSRTRPRTARLPLSNAALRPLKKSPESPGTPNPPPAPKNSKPKK